MKIATHSGRFHADEALAIFMLKQLPEFRDAEVIRSRNSEDWKDCDLVVDVSAKYAPPKFYDHHQRNFKVTFNNKHRTPLSSAGLIYKHYGQQVLGVILDASASSEVVQAIYERIYSHFVEPIDACDNGISPFQSKAGFEKPLITLPCIIATFRTWDAGKDNKAMDAAFENAVKFIGTAFTMLVKTEGLYRYPSRKLVERAFIQRKTYDYAGRILVLDDDSDWKSHLHSVERHYNAKILLIIYQSQDNKYHVRAAPRFAFSFQPRIQFPSKWWGLEDDNLSKVTGIEGCTFVHPSGFIGGCKTREAAIALANRVLARCGPNY